MRTKLIACLDIVSLFVLLINISPLDSQRAGCGIGVHVQDDEGNPKQTCETHIVDIWRICNPIY